MTWVAATLWLAPLVYATLRHLHLRFTAAWWAMVFPLGMYSSATFAMKVETGWRPFKMASVVFFWVAFAAWLAGAPWPPSSRSSQPGADPKPALRR